MAASLRQGGGSISSFQGTVNYCAWSRWSCTDDPEIERARSSAETSIKNTDQRPLFEPAAPRPRAARRGDCRPMPQGRLAAPSLDHLIRPLQERRRDRQAEGLKLITGSNLIGCSYRQIAGRGTAKDLNDARCDMNRALECYETSGHLRMFSTHSSFNKIVSISASPPPAASRKKMIARPGYPKIRNAVSTRMSIAAPIISAANSRPRVMRLATF